MYTELFLLCYLNVFGHERITEQATYEVSKMFSQTKKAPITELSLMKEKLAFPYLFMMSFFILLYSISKLHTRCLLYIIKEAENSEELYSCLIIEGPILNHWKN